MKDYRDFLNEKIKFGYLEYLTLFKYGSKEFKSKVCFAEMINSMSSQNQNKVISFSVKICLDDSLFKTNRSHLCLFSIEDIRKYINMLSRLLCFKYNTKIIDGNFIIVNVFMENKNNDKTALLIATCIRYLYEFPYNIILLDALRLHNQKEFKGMHILNCILTVGSILGTGLGYGHGLGYPSDYPNISLLTPKKEIITKIGKIGCNAIFNFRRRNEPNTQKNFPYFTKGREIDFPKFVDDFDNRLQFYIEFKNKFKE